MDTNQYFVHYRDEDGGGIWTQEFMTDAEARRYAEGMNNTSPDTRIYKITRFIWNPDPVEVQVYPLPVRNSGI